MMEDKSAMTKDEMYRMDKYHLRITLGYANLYGNRQRDALLAEKVMAERACYDVQPELEIYYRRELVDKVVAAIDDHGNIVDETAYDAIRELGERIIFEEWFLGHREWYLNWCKETHREP